MKYPKEYGIVKQDLGMFLQQLRKKLKDENYHVYTEGQKFEYDNVNFVDDTQMTETEDTITFDSENKKIEVPKTGDNSAVRLALGVMLLAFLGIAWVVVKIFKKKDNK